jgi:hypothetical protein
MAYRPKRDPIPMSNTRRHVHSLVRSFLRDCMEYQAVAVMLPLLITSERKRIMEALASLDHEHSPRLVKDVRRDLEELARHREGGGRVH